MYFFDFSIKKVISLLLLGVIIFTNFTLWANAQDLAYNEVTFGMQSSDDTPSVYWFWNRFYEVKENQEIMNQNIYSEIDFVYKDVYNKNRDKTFPKVNISSNLWYYMAYADYTNKNFADGVMTNVQIASFFIVVQMKNFREQKTFAIPINNDDKYFYLYLEQDDLGNNCFYLDYENLGIWKKKLSYTCYANPLLIADPEFNKEIEEPYMLFFQIQRNGYGEFNIYTNTFWDDERDSYEIYYTKHNGKKQKDGKTYISYKDPERFEVQNSDLLEYSWIISMNQPMNSSYDNFPQISHDVMGIIYNSLTSYRFKRIGNQNALVPYSFSFREYFKDFIEKKCDNSGYLKNYQEWDFKYCNKTLNVDPYSFFDYFIYNVSRQVYTLGYVTREHEYYNVPTIKIPSSEEKEESGLLEYNKCDGWLSVGCHVSNIGISITNGFLKMIWVIWNFIGWIVSSFWNIFKEIFSWIATPIDKFLKAYIFPVYNFFTSNISDIKKYHLLEWCEPVQIWI